jgi:hypothetical protein
LRPENREKGEKTKRGRGALRKTTFKEGTAVSKYCVKM